MDDGFAFLDDAEFQRALVMLEEATRLASGKKRLDPVVRRLELAMRKAFRAQGSVFLRKFRERLRSRFQEGFAGHATFLCTPLKETLTPVEWLIIWFEVASKTSGMFSKPIDQAVEKALSMGALNALGEIGVRISFSLANPRAEAYLKEYGAQLVTRINEETRVQIQTIINQAISGGWSYDRTAQAITEKFQQFAVGMPQQHIDSRAHLVAVTETGNAYAEGQLEVAHELAAAGIEMEKAWSTVGDDRVTEGCRENEAAGWIGLNESFPSGHQRPLRFPGCRCDLLTRRKE